MVPKRGLYGFYKGMKEYTLNYVDTVVPLGTTFFQSLSQVQTWEVRVNGAPTSS